MNTSLRRAWLPAILWIVVIALESTSLGSTEHTSRLLLPLLTFFFGTINLHTYAQVHHCIRKAGHFFGYALLSLFLFRAWWATLTIRPGDVVVASWRDMSRLWMARPAMLALASTMVVAALDEWHQTILASRTGEFSDFLLDSFAGVFAQVLLIAFSQGRRMRLRFPMAVDR